MSRYVRLSGLLTVVYTFGCAWMVSLSARAQSYETAVQPLPDEQFKSARYRIWLPANGKPVRGIIVKQHGCGTGASSTGLHHADDLHWQALAEKHQVALMGTELTNDALCAQWFGLKGGSGKAFLRALGSLARISQHPELTQVPWALWGHSGGGYWCTEMLFEYPERILCVIPRSGGISTMYWNPAVKSVPVMWMAGEKDIVDGQDYVKALTVKSFLGYRRFGAFWGMAIDPKADHGNRDGRSFYIRWMDAMLGLRLSTNGNQPMPLDSLSGWLGHPTTLDIKPFRAVNEGRNQMVWLPNEAVARAWQEFSRTGWVTDVTPPPTPTKVELSGEHKLVWQATTDLESGLRQFNIYRDGVRVDSIKGQKSNFGDAPVPRQVDFTYRLPAGTSASVYSVSAVNHQGLESARSEPVRLIGNRKRKGKKRLIKL